MSIDVATDTLRRYLIVAATRQRTVSATWVRPAGRLVAVVLGGLHTFAAARSHSMNPDGVAYMDVGDAYLSGNWGAAINSYWSPLYSWILGVTLHVVRPSMHWEFPVVHVVNFGIYLLALVCFERLWHELGRFRQARSGADSVAMPEWAWLALGYALFLYAALNLVRVWSVTPDMLVAALVYLAAALVVRARSGEATWRTYALLGTVLGLGYLAKTAMFPLAFVFLGAAFLATRSVRNAGESLRLALVGLTCLLAIAGPYIGLLSVAKGRPTFGDTGKLMYAWHVNAVPHPHWQGEVAGAGLPRHGSRVVFRSPAIYEFGRPSGRGTYPIAYDPAYWYEGVTPHFEWKGQARVLAISLQYYFDVFVRQQAGLIVGILALCFFRPRSTGHLMRRITGEWGLMVVALAALLMYALVHVQGRYIGPFVVLLWGDLLAGARLPASDQSRKLLSFIGAIMLAVVLVNVFAFTLERGGRFLGVPLADTASGGSGAPAEPSWPGDVADELHRLGVRPGDKVATIGYAFDSYWARLARVQIVAEMFDWEARPFWSGTPSFQSDVLRAFARSGASAVVAERVPVDVDPAEWHRVGTSGCYIYVFNGFRDAASKSDAMATASPTGSVT